MNVIKPHCKWMLRGQTFILSPSFLNTFLKFQIFGGKSLDMTCHSLLKSHLTIEIFVVFIRNFHNNVNRIFILELIYFLGYLL